MGIQDSVTALNNPIRGRFSESLKDRFSFLPALPEHADLGGVCVAYVQEKARLCQSTVSNCMGLLKQAGFIVAERHGRWMIYRCDEEKIKVLITTFKNELTNTGSLSRARRRHGYHCHGCSN